MRIVGGNLKGGSFYPSVDKKLYPTKHKYGATVTWSAHTDTYRPTLAGHGIDAEILAFKYNLQLTTLISPSTDRTYTDEIKGFLETGRMDTGIYFRAFLDQIQEQVDFHKEVTGRDASYWSYGNGIRDHDEFVLSNGLITRSSASGEVDYDFDTILSKKVATVFNYNVRDYGMEYALNQAEEMLNQAISESGWYNDFSHWHWADVHGDKDQLEQFFSQQREILNSVNAITLGSGEAVEYMWLRKQFKRGGLYQDGNELVLISDVRNTNNLPYKAIDTTLSVEVDLTDTILENKEIASSTEVLKVADNKYIVQIPYSNRDGFRTVRLKETNQPNYLDLSLPSITSVNKENDILTVETDKPTNLVLFSTPSVGRLYQAEVVERSNLMSNQHEITITDTNNKDFYIGVITKEKQSVLSDKYNLNES